MFHCLDPLLLLVQLRSQLTHLLAGDGAAGGGPGGGGGRLGVERLDDGLGLLDVLLVALLHYLHVEVLLLHRVLEMCNLQWTLDSNTLLSFVSTH